MIKTALIMAGGKGERFWPKSRKRFPKQFLSLTGEGKSMIQLTVERILPVVDIKNIYISTNSDYKDIVREQLPYIPKENILCEPVGRNTAPCIGFAAVNITQKYDNAIMMVLPSDHIIKDTKTFIREMEIACEIAEKDNNLVTIGITPTYPETGYGYIRYQKENEKDSVFYPVEQFIEKPNIEEAKEFLSTGSYLWNSGIFIWKCSSILGNMKKLMPDLYEGLMKIRYAIGTSSENGVIVKEFSSFSPVSVDYGIMEKAEHIYTMPGDFGWVDIGSWAVADRIQSTDEFNNVTEGNVITVDTGNCVIQGGEKLIATIGLNDTVIIDTEDVTLVCAKESVGEIQTLLSELKNRGQTQYL